jgi:hypothetical protein
MTHAVPTTTLLCRTTAGACAEVHTAQQRSTTKFLTGNVEALARAITSFAVLVGVTLYSAVCEVMKQKLSVVF